MEGEHRNLCGKVSFFHKNVRLASQKDSPGIINEEIKYLERLGWYHTIDSTYLLDVCSGSIGYQERFVGAGWQPCVK